MSFDLEAHRPELDALMARVGTFRNRLVNLEDPRPGGAKRFAEAMGRIRTAGLATLGGEKVVSWEDFQSGLWHGHTNGKQMAVVTRASICFLSCARAPTGHRSFGPAEFRFSRTGDCLDRTCP